VLIGELKIVDTLGDLPNIIWEACNENQARNRFENAVNNYTTRYETQTKGFGRHLTMPRDLPSHWDVARKPRLRNAGAGACESAG
jgi:hypothetical protein